MKENDALGLNYQFDNQIVRSECGGRQSAIQGKREADVFDESDKQRMFLKSVMAFPTWHSRILSDALVCCGEK